METQTFKIESSQSSVEWTGKKVTGSHNGTIGVKEGALSWDSGKLTGGNFVIDMASIKILDVTDRDTNAQFAGHLASDDFFSIEKFPTANLVITSAIAHRDGGYHIDGDLTIKNIAAPVSFNATVQDRGADITASGKIIIDRTRYDIKFRSGNFFKDLGDNLIYNDFELNVFITAKAV